MFSDSVRPQAARVPSSWRPVLPCGVNVSARWPVPVASGPCSSHPCCGDRAHTQAVRQPRGASTSGPRLRCLLPAVAATCPRRCARRPLVRSFRHGPFICSGLVGLPGVRPPQRATVTRHGTPSGVLGEGWASRGQGGLAACRRRARGARNASRIPAGAAVRAARVYAAQLVLCAADRGIAALVRWACGRCGRLRFACVRFVCGASRCGAGTVEHGRAAEECARHPRRRPGSAVRAEAACADELPARVRRLAALGGVACARTVGQCARPAMRRRTRTHCAEEGGRSRAVEEALRPAPGSCLLNRLRLPKLRCTKERSAARTRGGSSQSSFAARDVAQHARSAVDEAGMWWQPRASPAL
ncbi:hypothetical protein ERJ75_001141400 [Trypanosoma vivax]|nr:hypothetical protein ERJ75_001141400 [Trypanosoma vivax]